MTTATISAAASPPAAAGLNGSKKRKTSQPEIEVDLELPEPPSKKAKRLLKKGKKVPTKPASDDEAEDGGDDGDDKKKKKTKKEQARSEHAVWVGNLPFSATKAALRQWLVDSSGGAIAPEAITRVHLPTGKPGSRPGNDDDEGENDNSKEGLAEDGEGKNSRKKKAAPPNKGFAYVDFATYDAAVAAIALSESDLAGRRLLIKDAKSFAGRPAKEAAATVATEGGPGIATKPGKPGTAAAAPANASRKIFVGNLSFQTDEEAVRAHFDKCGPIEWAKVATFEDTGKCKGYGWVRFGTAEAAACAVQGFVRIREEEATEEDFLSDGGGGDDDGDDEDNEDAADGGEGEEGGSEKRPRTKKKKEPRKVRTRKWWVNQLRGRNLKIEFAEDDQVRYKKRFGKDRDKAAAAAASSGGKAGERRKSQGGEEGRERARPSEPKFNYTEDIQVARLTGAIPETKSEKIVFDE